MSEESRFLAGEFSRAAWAASADVRGRISDLPFLRELAAGSLDPRAFANYILQDEYYLAGYAKALALLAARSPNASDLQFWAGSAGESIAEERALHAQLLGSPEFAAHRAAILAKAGLDPDAPLEATDLEALAAPTAVGYTASLVAAAAVEPYPIAVAAVLPCYWVYAEVGAELIATVGDGLEAHRYRPWIEAYGAPGFDAVVHRAVGIYEAAAASANAGTRARMVTTFRRASRYELAFWDSAYALESWD